ncbi:hypothetical protein B6U99_01470 [Candidatus Geothermarchaeota archaeon ex4572_27]|nr:MAG: hypothetical protein B6U99_01470 [Candidatus Geothermarchaeota archaeon ex4572_27]
MIEVYATELRDLKELICASRSVSSVVVAYRFGEIRIYGGIAYIVTSLGRNYWYVLYTRNFNIKQDTEAIEFTPTGEINEVSPEEVGRDPKAVYYVVIRPVRDDVIEPVLRRIREESEGQTRPC